jgi:hypothetical protein
MKTKIFLLILIFGASYLSWNLFVDNFSQEPIEIVANSYSDNSTSKEIIPSKITKNTEKKKGEEVTEVKIENSPTSESESEKSSTEKTLPIEKEKEVFSENENSSFIINKKTTWGFSISNSREIDTLVIHSSYDALGAKPYDLEGLINEYKEYGVAPHFLIDRKGKIYRLVDEKNIAYHAGVSKMPDGRTEVNNFSIGIELMNTKEDNYTENQYSSLNKLINYLEDNHQIKYILGHQDISPDRKTDPWSFNWKKVNSDKSIHN